VTVCLHCDGWGCRRCRRDYGEQMPDVEVRGEGELARDNAQLREQNELLRQAVREESAERRRLEQEVARRYALV